MMTNRQIEKYKNQLTEIVKEHKLEKGECLVKYLKKLTDSIKKLQKLSETVGARSYIGIGLSDLDEILKSDEKDLQKFTGNIGRRDNYIVIVKEISDNITYKLNTEMMFNACVSAKESSELARRSCNIAKWSCIFAAIAAIAACVSIVLTWLLK